MLAGDSSAAAALKLIQARRYGEAYPSIFSLAAASPKDMSLQYYLGLCAMNVHNLPLAELAFARIIVRSPAQDPFAVAAKKALATFRSQLMPYSSLCNNKSLRWSPQAMPLRIWMSDGRTLPAPYVGCIMDAATYQAATNVLQSGGSLSVTPSYDPAYRQSALAGLRWWDWAVKEGIFSYVFTDSPRDADIVVLFVEHPPLKKAGYTLYPYANHQPCIVQLECALSDGITRAFKVHSMEYIMAHELGHSLGLGHSNNRSDLMTPGDEKDTGTAPAAPVTACSENDRASLRAIYSMPPDAYFVSARK
ncbi:MAG: matrixin family metalloprotease [Cyanobacteria bacterium SZAS LIN-3]|nr:matrixin family metalloprotease [Cyanobacteria bacterium SZAS LIN-3]